MVGSDRLTRRSASFSPDATVLVPMPETPPDPGPIGADLIGAAAALSNEEITDRLDGLFRQKAAVEGAIVVLLGEVDRRQAYRDEGATRAGTMGRRALRRLDADGTGVHASGREGMGHPAPGRVALRRRPLLRQGPGGRRGGHAGDGPGAPGSGSGVLRAPARRRGPLDCCRHLPVPTTMRRFLRFNDRFRTMTVQLPAESFAETRASLEARARKVPSDGETRGTNASATPSWN